MDEDGFLDEWYDFLAEEGEEPYDPVVEAALPEVKEFFKQRSDEVFYLRQIEVRFEKKYYHWITRKAVYKLEEEGEIESLYLDLKLGTQARFFYHKSKRYVKRDAQRLADVIDKYSEPQIAQGCGRQAEVLFQNALGLKGFHIHSTDVREWDGKLWVKTEHDLDWICGRDGVLYGCEVKNSLGYIDREELETKLEICEFFGVKPLFIMRQAATTYNWEIIKKGGYAMIFEMQVYPFGQKKLVNEIREKVGLPVDCPRDIPAGIIDRFERWHVNNL